MEKSKIMQLYGNKHMLPTPHFHHVNQIGSFYVIDLTNKPRDASENVTLLVEEFIKHMRI